MCEQLRKRMETIGCCIVTDREIIKNKRTGCFRAAEGGLMYNPKSTKATEFIDHQEILDSLEYARANKNNTELIEGLIERARDCKGLSHREAALLLECDDPVLVDKMYHVAKRSNRNFMETELLCLRLFTFLIMYQRLCLLSLSCKEQTHPP